MDIYDFAENINTKQDFVEFLSMLKKDYRDSKNEWENDELDSFLEGMFGFAYDLEGYHLNTKQEKDVNEPTWKDFADILLAAKVYE